MFLHLYHNDKENWVRLFGVLRANCKNLRMLTGKERILACLSVSKKLKEQQRRLKLQKLQLEKEEG